MLLVNSITSVINKNLEVLPRFPENLDVKYQRKEKSRWEYWYDSCLMNHGLWKHRIFRIFGRFSTDFSIFTRQSNVRIWIISKNLFNQKVDASKVWSYSYNQRFCLVLTIQYRPLESVVHAWSFEDDRPLSAIKAVRFYFKGSINFWLHNWLLRKRSLVTPDDLVRWFSGTRS